MLIGRNQRMGHLAARTGAFVLVQGSAPVLLQVLQLGESWTIHGSFVRQVRPWKCTRTKATALR